MLLSKMKLYLNFELYVLHNYFFIEMFVKEDCSGRSTYWRFDENELLIVLNRYLVWTYFENIWNEFAFPVSVTKGTIFHERIKQILRVIYIYYYFYVLYKLLLLWSIG